MERKPYASVRFWSLVLSLWIPMGCGESAPSSVNAGQGGNHGGAGGKGGAGAGGTSASGGSAMGGSSGGSSGSGGKSEVGGNGGTSAGGAAGSSGDAGGSGGKGSGGTAGATGVGGKVTSGGTTGSGGGAGSTGAGGKGGAAGASGAGGGGAGGGGSVSTDCTITISSGDVSPKMATVGVVEWSTSLSNVASAQIVYTLNNAGASILNKGGTAPVDLKKTNYRTLLLGLKPSSTYTYHVEATTSSGSVCKSADKTLTTGTLSGAPTITRTATNPTAQAGGFIVTSSGQGAGGGGFGGGGGAGSSGAFIIDADGTVVWYAAAPSQCSRAHMDYEGVNMWMLALNVQNSGGEMRFMSMDGVTSKTSISGLSGAHHDFTVLPGKIAAMVWASSGSDPESNLVEMASDGSGSATTKFKIGSNLYAGGSSAFGGGSSGNAYHCNYIIYHPADDSFTISDRNPNLFVKVKHDGTPVWQIGGSCTNAKAPKCASGTWQVNHGHDFDGNGNMMVFNNGQSGSTHIFDLKVNETASAVSYTTSKDFTSTNNSNVMGDVQYLPNGNRLIAYSSASVILEVDASWATVQTLKGAGGYADWRPTLYGPPARK